MTHARATGCVEVAVAIVEHAGKYLIARREEDAPLAGFWEFPGGKLKPGESPAEAAARECLEEAGLIVEIGSEYQLVEHDYDHARVRIHFFTAALVSDPAGAPHRFRWVGPNELASYTFPPANRDVIAKLSQAE
ncbi:MAG TPA: (deoxy)nucleoside triphosphate pyrophosphohydrolase [Pirellulales bacterium]|jgi:mutator protein MutT|nr:(deoxy)nucleoside triphosphate pyrophosphohydrolase [Pirellulales bacterium]